MNTNNTQKVDTAVIFASGIGKRMMPLTYDTPKCMLKIDNERMIERQIRFIKEAGINDIIIVVGYLHHTFEYLKNKYNVRLVYNENFKLCNTLYTLKCVLPYIKNKNVYFTNSDFYIKNNIFNNEESGSHYKGIYVSGENNEWDCTLNDKNEILKVDKIGKDSYCMVGIAYFDKKDVDTLEKDTDILLKDDNAKDYFWEEILYKNIDHFPHFYMHKLDNNDLIEFDNYIDYINYDKNNTSTGSLSYEIISKAMDAKENGIKVIDCIDGGLTNRSFVFKLENNNKYNKKYIMRVPGVETYRFIDRKIEKTALDELKKYDIIENVIYIDENKGYKISEYYDDAKTININNESELKLAMQSLKYLHSLDINIPDNKNIYDFIDCHIKTIKECHENFPFDDINILKDDINYIIDIMKKYKRPTTFCHGDANPYNMLNIGGKIRFIDFEYVMRFDPLFEIAMFALNGGMDVDKLRLLFNYYKDAEGTDIAYKNLNDKDIDILLVGYYALSEYYCYLWGINFQNFNFLDYRNIINDYHAKANLAINKFKELNK